MDALSVIEQTLDRLAYRLITVTQVAWLDQNSIPLTYEERRVIDDSRFSVVRPLVRDWNLQLQDVTLDDAGVYRCTVNTKPIASKVVSLQVTGQLQTSHHLVVWWHNG